jgi:hypothetical protein
MPHDPDSAMTRLSRATLSCPPVDDSRRAAESIYDMYLAHRCQVGFWIKRKTWGDLCAQVTFVGELEPRAPAYGQPPVRADVYHFRSGVLKQADVEITAAASSSRWQEIPPPPLHAWQHGRKRPAPANS